MALIGRCVSKSLSAASASVNLEEAPRETELADAGNVAGAIQAEKAEFWTQLDADFDCARRFGSDLRVMRAIPGPTRYKRSRQNAGKSNELTTSTWVVLVPVGPSLDIEKT